MPRILVIRFGSLGDLCLLAWSLGGVAAAGAAATRPRVTLAVKAAFAPLLATVPGIDAVAPLRGPGLRDLARLARDLRTADFDRVLDAHGVLRSRLLCVLLGARVERRLAKDTAARLALLRARRGATRAPDAPSLLSRRTMLRRFDEVVAGRATDDDDAPHGDGPGAALLARGGCPLYPAGRPAAAPRLGLAPGARWDTKRWPEAHWAGLLRGWRAASPAPVELFLGAQERAWFPGGELARAAAEVGGVNLHVDLPLPALATRLAACRVVVTNDSGLLHLAEAAGTPVLALFGPTVRAFGYFPLLPDSRVLETDLPCRPCSRNGRRPCWRGDLACLATITPQAALDALLALPAWRTAPAPEVPRG